MNKEYIRELLDSIDVAVISPFEKDDWEREIKSLVNDVFKEVNKNIEQANYRVHRYINDALYSINDVVKNRSEDDITAQEIYFFTEFIRKILNKI